jgi:hypothetical protein
MIFSGRRCGEKKSGFKSGRSKINKIKRTESLINTLKEE